MSGSELVNDDLRWRRSFLYEELWTSRGLGTVIPGGIKKNRSLIELNTDLSVPIGPY